MILTKLSLKTHGTCLRNSTTGAAACNQQITSEAALNQINFVQFEVQLINNRQ